jgi:hypothetical protein
VIDYLSFYFAVVFSSTYFVSAKNRHILDDFNINRRCAPSFSVHLRCKEDRDGEGDRDGDGN